MNRNDLYMVAAYQVFKLVDIELLDESLNGGDREYAEDVIDLLMMAHQNVYEDPELPEEGEDTVIYPVLIRDKESGRERLGLAMCSIIRLSEDIPLFELLKGRLPKVEAIQLPVEYRNLSRYSEEDTAEERDVTVSVIVGKNCFLRCCGDISGEDDEEIEEGIESEEEIAGETIGLTQ